MLAALLLRLGEPVPIDTLVDQVWGARPPRRSRNGLAAYASRLRPALAQGGDGSAAAALSYSAGGYLLECQPERVDVYRSRRLVREARECVDDLLAADLLRQAGQGWAAVALAGIPGDWADRARERLHRERLDVLAEQYDADLRLGRHAAVVDELRELVSQYPAAEELVARLMLALAGAGRSVEALDYYARLRTVLAEDLGSEPSTPLRELHLRVLRDDPTLAAAPPAGAPPRRAAVCTLPRETATFVGRKDLADRVLAAAGIGAVGVVITLNGMPGVGKTALAVHLAYRLADRFPDGQLYVNLRGYDPAGMVLDSGDALRRLLDALDVSPQRIPADLDAGAALYRSQLAGRRMLLVLDNARDSAQVRPLLPGSPGCLVVVTSRSQLTGLVAADGAYPLTLDVLSTVEARELLARRLGPGRVAAEPQAVEQIITGCAQLPLALVIAAARAATNRRLPLAALAGELADTRARLNVLAGDDPATDVRAVFSWSYQALTTAAARLFRLLGLHPGPDVSAAAAASLAAVPGPKAGTLLTELTRAGLVVEYLPGRYALHDLLRTYAGDLTHGAEQEDQRRAATGRLLDHYTHTAHAAARLLYPGRDPIQLALAPAAPGTCPEQLTDEREAMGWLTAERQVLLAALGLAARNGFDTHTWQLAWALTTFLHRRGDWHDEATTGQAAVAAADRLAQPIAAALAHRNAAWGEIMLGRYGEADAHLYRALGRHAEAGDTVGRAYTHNTLAYLWSRQDRPDRSLGHATEALTLFRLAGHQRGEADALNNVGWYHTVLGDHRQALVCCQQALALHQQIGDRPGEANTCDSLGYAHHHLGDHARAADCYRHALGLYRDLGERFQEATTLTHLGETQQAAGDSDAARRSWQQALTILTDLDHSDADQVRAKLAGRTIGSTHAHADWSPQPGR
jgi:tetratricopeptide (TPR) repeat protein